MSPSGSTGSSPSELNFQSPRLWWGGFRCAKIQASWPLILFSAGRAREMGRISGGRGIERGGQAEELDELALKAVEFGREGMDDAAVLNQVMTLEAGEESQDALGGGRGAFALFGVDRQTA